MTAVVVEKPHQLRIREARAEEPGEGEVLVRVRRAGICGSDLHIFHGTNPFAKYPRVIGHEFAGEIAAVGPGVSGFSLGDRVVVDPVVACGHCYPCRVGRPNVCANLEVMGVHRDGGFRDRLAVPAANAVPVGDLPFEIAAMAEPFSIAANVLDRTGGAHASDTVLIYGAGMIGLTVLMAARLEGARCIVTDIDDARLARAAELGAARVINAKRESVPEAMKTENDGLGPSLVIEAAGAPGLVDEATRVASPAGRIGLLGFTPEPTPIVQQEIVKKELTIAGSRLNRHLLPRVVVWFKTRRIDPRGLVSQVFPARDAAAAFELIERDPGSTMKVQLSFD
ncbi:Starvation-sensing protein RspB [uncultured Alphaproteobacteria bacterium]|uniref:Starvation-sensing protein RspB n=1 Tax=uncultured Alphaproteobacteria bacterium TaxID=91750 RepID=A0A212JD73_9PROT|nr:Starvation-sensing protein RspB [uncultured Alphaproteobacteria bacterium]